MATLSSSSTLAECEAEYQDTCGYLEDESAAHARRFVAACHQLLQRLPSTAVKGSNTLSYRLESIEKARQEAERWLEGHDENRHGPRVLRADFRGLRS